MRDELDKLLCKKYPKIFRDRHAPMGITAMCWGFDCGDGWFNILDKMCGLMQWHIDQSRKQRARDLRYNRGLKQAIANGTVEAWVRKDNKWQREGPEKELMIEKKINNILLAPEQVYRPATDAVHQVVATQVKEKFGTLRFYYDGGDDFCRGVEAMADAMTGVTCEECGAPGVLRGGGWIRCLCDAHAIEQDGTVRPLLDDEQEDMP